jgi:lysophospholipase L1-like esterase
MDSRAPRRARLLGAAVVLIASLVALGAAELVLRIWLPVRGVIFTLDDRYLFRHIPGSRRLADAGDGSWPGVLVRINDAGRRGDEAGLARGARRVVVYGDSFVSAEDTPESETFTAELERQLTGRLGPTEVLNAGVTGYGPDQIARRMEDELPSLRPAVTVVALFAGNDFGDLLRNRLFKLDEHGALVPNQPVIDDDLRRSFTAPLQWSSIQIVRLVQSAMDRARRDAGPGAPSVAVDRTATRLANRIPEYQSYVVSGDNGVRNLVADEYDADVSLEPNSESARYRVRLMAAVLARLRQIADANGSRLLLLVIPEWCDAGGPCAETEARRRYPAYRPEGLTGVLNGLAREAGIGSVDLFGTFRASGAASLYYPRDEHWNVAGQRIAAIEVAKVIAGSTSR